MKHELKIKYCLRYTDDFIIVHHDKNYLKNLIPKIENFLQARLKLCLHPDKIVLGKLSYGFDFLGYIILPHHKLLRTKTKNRMLKKVKIATLNYQLGEISKKSLEQTVQSYLGLLKHCNSRDVKEELRRGLSNY